MSSTTLAPLAYASSAVKRHLFGSWFYFAPLPQVSSASSVGVHLPPNLSVKERRGGEKKMDWANKWVLPFILLFWLTKRPNENFFYLFSLTRLSRMRHLRPKPPRISGGGGVICPIYGVYGFKMLCIVIHGVNWMSAQIYGVIQTFSNKFIYYI